MPSGLRAGGLFHLLPATGHVHRYGMTLESVEAEKLFLIDDEHLFRGITDLLTSPDAENVMGTQVSVAASCGTGFTTSRRFLLNGNFVNFLLLCPDNAHPFAYLTLGQQTLKNHLSLIVAISQARSLDPNLYPGDIALVSEAAALPYPALFQCSAPHTIDNADVYKANPETIEFFYTLAKAVTLPQVWQKQIPIIRTGYAKHPTWRGGLKVWAPEQVTALRAAGLTTWSETPVGVYEAQALTPGVKVVCFNMVVAPIETNQPIEWHRRKDALVYPAARAICDILLHV